MPLPRPALDAMAAKYEALIVLRRTRDGDANAKVSAATKLELRRLSQVFPGCLKELDRCSLAVLTQRLEDVQAAKRHAPAPWLKWMWRYHELLRVALDAKGGRPHAAPGLRAFLAACEAPPQGRLVPLVLEQLGHETHTPVAVLQDALFPPR
ncbi:MAG: hypothetical protein SF187_29230 [Deltaproteobacteria bacterium]|nr:hypothetical protein [Deltaproteobacteria bacterium]